MKGILTQLSFCYSAALKSIDYNVAMTFIRNIINNNNNNKSSATVAVKQTLGRQVGQVREHECNMHVCVGVGSHWLKLLQTILLF